MTRKGWSVAAVLGLLALSATPVVAQTPADSAAALSQRAVAAYHEGTREGLERAIRLWSGAAGLYSKVGARQNQGTTLHNTGVVHNAFGRPDSACSTTDAHCRSGAKSATAAARRAGPRRRTGRAAHRG